MASGYRTAARATSAVQPVDECEMIAKIDGEVILACELLWRVNLRMEEIGSQIPPEHRPKVRDQLLQQQLMQMLDLRMIYADFRRKVPQADLNAIHESLAKNFEEIEVPKLMEEVGVEDPPKLDARLLELGTSLRERREDFYKSMIARSWMSEGLKFDKVVTHQQMLDYYRANLEKYEYPTQARWEELMVRYDKFPSDRDAYVAICAMGAQALTKLRQAKSAVEPVFGDIAKKRSHGLTANEGGLRDWTTQGALTAEKVDEAIFFTEVGRMSPIVRSDQGFHIVHVLERKQAGRTPFSEVQVQAEITKKIQDERFSKAINTRLAQLKRDAHVWTRFTGHLKRDEAAPEERENERR